VEESINFLGNLVMTMFFCYILAAGIYFVEKLYDMHRRHVIAAEQKSREQALPEKMPVYLKK